MQTVETPSDHNASNIRMLSRKERKANAKALGVTFEPIPYYAGAGKTVRIQYVPIKDENESGFMKHMTFSPVDSAFLVPA